MLVHFYIETYAKENGNFFISTVHYVMSPTRRFRKYMAPSLRF